MIENTDKQPKSMLPISSRIKLLAIGTLLLHSSIMAAPAINQKTELLQINHQIQHLQTTLDHTHQQQVDLQEQLKITELSLATLNQDITRIEQAEGNEQRKLKQLEDQDRYIQYRISKQRHALAKQVSAAYQLGRINEVKIVLNQENPETLSRHLGYYRYMTQERVNLMATIKQSLLEVTNTMQAISQHQQSLQHLLQEKQHQLTQQATAQLLRHRLIVQLTQEAQSKEQQLATLIANQKALEEALTHVMAHPISLPDSQPFPQLQGKLPWPVKGSITSAFGSPLDVGNQHLPGVIIQAPYGNPVRAISSGKIIFANWLRGFGLLVIINHGNGYMSLYARNGTLTVAIGDKVKSGDIIATIGNTGGHNLPSLYFEIRQNGIPVNPSLWCRYT